MYSNKGTQPAYRLIIAPSVRNRLVSVSGDLNKWLDFLLMRITIYFNHRFLGDVEYHDFRFRDEDGTRLVFPVVFTETWAEITGVVENDSSAR